MADTDLSDNLSTYREVLRHVVRPEEPTEREDSTRVTLDDFSALYLRRGLEEYQHYVADTTDGSDVAEAYVEYIDHVVRNEGRSTVTLYAHTPTARDVLRESAPHTTPIVNSLHDDVYETVWQEIERTFDPSEG